MGWVVAEMGLRELNRDQWLGLQPAGDTSPIVHAIHLQLPSNHTITLTVQLHHFITEPLRVSLAVCYSFSASNFILSISSYFSESAKTKRVRIQS